MSASRFPNVFAKNQMVRLPPEPDLGQVAKIPSVCNNTVIRRHEPGQKSGLYGASHRRRDALERPLGTVLAQSDQVGRIFSQQRSSESYDIDYSRLMCRQLRLSRFMSLSLEFAHL